jgi:hypothetical protein
MQLFSHHGESGKMTGEYPRKESVLVIVLSETRAYEHTFELFKKNLLNTLQADLCLCVANNPREVTDNPFYTEAKYIWSYDEPEDWGNAFDEAQATTGVLKDWRKLLLIKDQWLGGIRGEHEHPGSAGILLFFRWFLKKSILESGVLDHYDRFVITRSDFMHRIPHVPLGYLCSRFIWIPNGEDYGGYTDRHIVVNAEDLISVLSISDSIVEDPDELFSQMSFQSQWNLEKFIKFSFARAGIVKKVRRYPYTMYSVRSIDGHTRWSEGKYASMYHYYIKYDDEYKSYRLAAAFVKEVSDWSRAKIVLINFLWNTRDMWYRVLRKIRKVAKGDNAAFPPRAAWPPIEKVHEEDR